MYSAQPEMVPLASIFLQSSHYVLGPSIIVVVCLILKFGIGTIGSSRRLELLVAFAWRM